MTVIHSLMCTVPFSFVVTLMSVAATHCHLLSLVVSIVVTLCHSLYDLLSPVVNRCHSLSLVVTRRATRCHSLSLDVPLVCLFINNLLIMSLQDFCLSVVYVLKFNLIWCFKSPPQKYFWFLFWLKCIKCRPVLSVMDEYFRLIVIPVGLLVRTMEIYYMSMGEFKFKEHLFCDCRSPCDILSCFLENCVFLMFARV